MKSIKYLQSISYAVTALVTCLLFSPLTHAKDKKFERIVVFGASLSDSGNAFILLSDPMSFGFDETCGLGTPANVPPYDLLDDFLIPDGSYAKGGHHVTNGATWIEQFARGQGLSGSTQPALRNAGIKASNYAVGGARAADYPCRFNLDDQLAVYQQDFPEVLEKTLFVFELGGNDVRDALAASDPSLVIEVALGNIGAAVQALYGQGATDFLLVNVPAIGATPAVKMLDVQYGAGGAIINAANALAVAFNDNLAQLQAGLNLLPNMDVRVLNLYEVLNSIIADPAGYGIINTEQACVTPNVAPFKCKKPDTYLFWDGIHPTKVVHDIMAQKALEVLM